MDRKIRISFFPADASRVRVLYFSRKYGIIITLFLLALCLVGFWLLLSGTLHEDPQQMALRRKLRMENMALRERIHQLDQDGKVIDKGFNHLEELKIDALMLTGLSGNGSSAGGGRDKLLQFLKGVPTPSDLGAALNRAKATTLFYDSTLVVLTNLKDQASRFPTGLPVPHGALLTRGFGPTADPFTGRKSIHSGLDFSDRLGAAVYAGGAGEITATLNDPVWGLTVRINHGHRVETVYAHLNTIRVRQGQIVARGDVIGTLGQSGQATGPHLHFEIRLKGERVDPLKFLLPMLRTEYNL